MPATSAQPLAALPLAGAPPLSDKEFEDFRRLIHQVAGISMAPAKKPLLVGRLGKRLRHHGFGSFAEYHRYLNQGTDQQEFQLMIDLLTTNETYFFREEKHFDFLRKLALAHPGGRPFEVWSAASSSGEEVYTIAMVLADTLGIDGNWSITGSDISLSVLRVAEAGCYPLDTTRGLPREYLHRYCLKGIGSQAGKFSIDPALKAKTRFLQINLNQSLPSIGPFDVVFLRNAMIYFDQATKRQVVQRIGTKLRSGGHFIVGHSETLNGLSDTLELAQPTIYRKPAP